MRGLILITILFFGAGSLAPAAFAAPRITESTQTYDVTATTASGLRTEMRRKGPRGYWGLTRWDIRWTGACRVSVKVHYFIPKHADPDAMRPALRQAFDRMLENLVAHERQHGLNGINAAREIADARCRGTQKIIQKYQAADRALDRQTRHGARTGVTLK